MKRTTADDSAILDLARRWAPYGSVPTGEIWVTFGMSPKRFYATLTRVLSTLGARQLSPDLRQSLEHLVVRHVRDPYLLAHSRGNS